MRRNFVTSVIMQVCQYGIHALSFLLTRELPIIDLEAKLWSWIQMNFYLNPDGPANHTGSNISADRYNNDGKLAERENKDKKQREKE